jgi:hypothetical protein
LIATRWVVLLASSLFSLGCSRSRDNGSADTAHTAVVSAETTARPNPVANEPTAHLAAAKCDHSLPTDTIGRPVGHADYTLAFRRRGGRLRLTRFAALEVAAD